MYKKIFVLICAAVLMLGLCGCVAVMATMAETSKARQTVQVSYGDAIDIVKAALKTQELKFESANIQKDIAEVKAVDGQDRTIRIYVSKVSETECLIAVRAGTTVEGKGEAEKILGAIVQAANKQ